jgi:putative DNA primase/helicase
MTANSTIHPRADQPKTEAKSSKVGLDDFLVARGAAALRLLLAEAQDPVRPPPDAPKLPNEADNDPYQLARIFLWGYARDLLRESNTMPPECIKLRYYCGEWYVWTGTQYRRVPAKEIRALVTAAVKQEFDRLNLEAQIMHRQPAKDDEKEKGPPEALKVRTGIVNDVMQALTGITLLPGEMEPPAWISGSGPFPAGELLAASNTLVHLPSLVAGRSAHSCPLSVDYFSVNNLGYDFRLDAPAPAGWLAFLDQLWHDDLQAVQLLQEWFGYCLTPDTRQQKILLVIGPKRSGKGTISRVLRAMIGPANVAGPTLSSLGTNFGLWPLWGKTLAVVSDARLSGGRSDTVVVERLLAISGEDAVTFDRKNLEPLTAKLATRFMILTNELPSLGDSSGALPSRFLLLHSPRSWYGKEDLGLTNRLLGELPGILLWAVEGWRRLYERGYFRQPDSGRELLWSSPPGSCGSARRSAAARWPTIRGVWSSQSGAATCSATGCSASALATCS